MKDVLIKIKGTQGLDGGEKDVVEFSTDGKMEISDGTVTLTYNEGQMMEGADIKTKLQATGNDVAIMERTGTMNSRLVIKRGARNNCFYSTPYGDLTIGIYGEEIDNRLCDTGGTLKMVYSIDSGGSLVSKNEVEITVREIEV